jgi:hypothetical protein
VAEEESAVAEEESAVAEEESAAVAEEESANALTGVASPKTARQHAAMALACSRRRMGGDPFCVGDRVEVG